VRGSEPLVVENDRVLVVPDPPGETPRVLDCRLVHLDMGTGHLILTPEDPNQPLMHAVDASVLVLVVRPGEPLFARACSVEAHVAKARWMVLYATADWQRIERRLVERTAVRLPAEGYRYMQTGGGVAVRGSIRDLSMTGFCFEAQMPVGLGELVVLNVQLSDAEVLRLRGQAVRIVRPQSSPSGQWEAGCQFWGVSQADQERVARLIQRLRA
jgi:PilZ domain